MDLGVLLGIVGLVLTVFFGVIGIRAVTKNIRSNSQKQKAGKGSTAIQSGRDTNINSGK
jgi:hypothetical protein